jgi:hypothetical protein
VLGVSKPRLPVAEDRELIRLADLFEKPQDALRIAPVES